MSTDPEDIYEHPEPGEWIMPTPLGYKMRCCDCSLVHSIDFEAGRMASDGGFVPDPKLRVMIRVERDEAETERSRQLDKANRKAIKVKKPRQTPPKTTKGTKPTPEGTGTRQRAGKAPQGARKPRQKPTATDFQTGSHIPPKDRYFCWGTAPENDEGEDHS